jgi:hypothetical protein
VDNDVNELLLSHDEELTNDDLIQLEAFWRKYYANWTANSRR